jgi:hypothetical protein
MRPTMKPISKQRVSYSDLIDSMGVSTVLAVHDGEYHGDTRCVVYRPDTGEWGFLCFGWGTCSGCDSLCACDTAEEIEELRDHMFDQTVWRANPRELLDFLQAHDWEGDHGGDGKMQFAAESVRLVRAVVSCPVATDPSDPDTLRVAADWHEERGDADAASAIREACQS